MSVPTKDSDLAQYSINFNTRGVADPDLFNLTTGQMTAYTALHTPWIAAYNAIAEGGRSKALVAAKNTAKNDLLPYARELYAFIQSSQTVTDENKALMGVTVRKTEPTPEPPPQLAPRVSVISVIGRTARYKLEDATVESKRRRPINAQGATILSFAGTTPPPAGDPSWKLEGQTGKNIFTVQFSNDITPGTPCWVVAMWYNRRGDYSPACEAVQTFLQIGPVAEAA